LARGDRKWSLNDGQIRSFRGVRVHVSTSYNRVEGNRRASRNGRVSALPPEIPTVTIRNCVIRLGGERRACSAVRERPSQRGVRCARVGAHGVRVCVCRQEPPPPTPHHPKTLSRCSRDRELVYTTHRSRPWGRSRTVCVQAGASASHTASPQNPLAVLSRQGSRVHYAP
jgi:hypothetical protein